MGKGIGRNDVQDIVSAYEDDITDWLKERTGLYHLAGEAVTPADSNGRRKS